MRVLFTVQPMFGHFHAMVPLAQALQEHSHEVAFATGKRFGPVVQHAGFRHFPCGFDFDGSGEILRELSEWKTITRQVPPILYVWLSKIVKSAAPSHEQRPERNKAVEIGGRA